SGVGLRAGVRLHVDVFRAGEERLDAVDGELLDDIDILTAAVPAATGITLGVFVREAGALRFHDGAGNEVFAGDEFDVLELARAVQTDGAGDFGIGFREGRARTESARELLDALRVAPAFELSAEERLDELRRIGRGDVARAEAENVRV